MLEQIVNSSTMDYLSRGLNAANLRHEVISDNIANVNTPNFKKSDVVFEDLLAKELYGDTSGHMALVRTNDRHLPISHGGGRVSAAVERQGTTTMRTDNNNVDIDVEMANMAKNQIYYNAMAKELSSYIMRVKNAISSK